LKDSGQVHGRKPYFGFFTARKQVSANSAGSPRPQPHGRILGAFPRPEKYQMALTSVLEESAWFRCDLCLK